MDEPVIDQPSQAPLPFVQPSSGNEPVVGQPSSTVEAPSTNVTSYEYSAPGPQPMEQYVIPQANPAVPPFHTCRPPQEMHRNHGLGIEFGNHPRSQTSYPLQLASSNVNAPNAYDTTSFQGNNPQPLADPRGQFQVRNYPMPQLPYPFEVAPCNPSIPIVPTDARFQGNHPQLQVDPREPLQYSSYHQPQSQYPMPAGQSNPNMQNTGFYGNPPQLPATYQAPLQNSLLNSSMDVPRPS